jgi:hypothetical protein
VIRDLEIVVGHVRRAPVLRLGSGARLGARRDPRPFGVRPPARAPAVRFGDHRKTRPAGARKTPDGGTPLAGDPGGCSESGRLRMNVYYLDARNEAVESLFVTAVYRFCETHAPPKSDLVTVHTEVLGGIHRKCVHLWSPEAVAQFEHYWNVFAQERAQSAPF